MRRSRGTGGLYLRGRVWWMAYRAGGKTVRESAHTSVKKVAGELLLERVRASNAGALSGEPLAVADLVEFLWWTGWRSSEAAGLEWSGVDLANRTIRLDTSKTTRGGGSGSRVFPYGPVPGLVARGGTDRMVVE